MGQPNCQGGIENFPGRRLPAAPPLQARESVLYYPQKKGGLSMDAPERKARILYGQHLTCPDDPLAVCRDLAGVQAQFLSAALHALAIRSDGPVEPDRLVKSWTIRGTVHLFDPADLPLFLHEGRDHFLRPIDRMEGDEYATLPRKRYFAGLILDELAGGPRRREELRAACSAHGMTGREAEGLFNSWGGLLRHLAETGRIVHTVSGEKAFRLCPPFTPMEEGPARLELARRYFAHYGPATLRDAAYFFGRPQREVKALMAQLPLEHAVVEGRDCFWLGQGEGNWPDIPDCLFLAGFDQLMLGYRKEDGLFLPPERLRGIFSLSGIVMAPILLRGWVAGRWRRQRGRVELTPFGRWPEGDKRLALAAADRLWGPGAAVWAGE